MERILTLMLSLSNKLKKDSLIFKTINFCSMNCLSQMITLTLLSRNFWLKDKSQLSFK